eukprot:Protomagalhaensia_sp_Gyna_25__4217@NODE_383_length_3630_cov_191_540518_g294_i0_p3_GENE_NODE_383_length_3630_cov_191_540518_g294_i0NODE_383_length_3630_cov_191_540518_g294_i0_p3_ORF_typecomplete_len293_score32_85_NODE_383_length_3630_cov_191_540518_g294_i010321910
MLFFVYWNLVVLAKAIPILRNAKVLLDCAAATGAISCDWNCYDACVSRHTSAYLTAEQMEECLRNVQRSCLIPALAYNTIFIADFCSIDAEAARQWTEDSVVAEQFSQPVSSGYVFTLPRISNQNWKWTVQTASIASASVDVDGDFDMDYCLAPTHYTVNAADIQLIKDPKNMCMMNLDSDTGVSSNEEFRSSESEVFDTVTSFGFKKLNLNFTNWAQNHEKVNATLGTEPLNVQLSSYNACWAKASNMTLYYSVDFTISTDEINWAISWRGQPWGVLFLGFWLMWLLSRTP